jgi:hypothetical protein
MCNAGFARVLALAGDPRLRIEPYRVLRRRASRR